MKKDSIIIEVKHGVSPSGQLTGRYYTVSVEGWSGEGLTENDAIRDAYQTRAESLLKVNHNNRGFGVRLNLAGVV